MPDHLKEWDKWFAGVDDTCEDITLTSNEIANTDPMVIQDQMLLC